MALAPATQDALAPLAETLDLGPGTENRQYQHLLAVAASQELRLARHAALRRRPGYDLSDPWLAAGDADGAGVQAQRLVPGMPCQLVGSGEVVAYLGPAEGDSHQAGLCRVRFPDGKVASHDRRYLLPMPTRPARQGDWALAVDLKGEHAKLNGRRGLCGLTGILAGSTERRGLWVMFEPTDPVAPPEMVLLEEANLVALPGPPKGAPRTPWEARCAALAGPSTGDATLALTDEAAQEERLALLDGRSGRRRQDDEESASVAGSVELSGGSDSEEGAHGVGEAEEPGAEQGGRRPGAFAPAAGDVVSVAALAGGATSSRRGCVQRTAEGEGGAGATATVWLFPEGRLEGGAAEFPAAALAPLAEDDLVLAAVCCGCGSAEPEEELLLCERFGKNCLGSAHLACLKPPLKAVPKGEWRCGHCGGASCSAPEGPPATKRARLGEAEAKAKAKARAAAAAPAPPPKAKAKAKAKAAAGRGGQAAAGSGSRKVKQVPQRRAE